MDLKVETNKAQPVQRSKQKMSKEERAEKRRNDHIAREKDRERKRAKRQNIAYRQLEQERDRERKKMLRSNKTFRTLEKIRDRMRKERKKFENDHESNFNLTFVDESIRNSVFIAPNDEVAEILLEPEIILSHGDVAEEEILLEPEVILSTNENTESQNPFIQIT